MSKCLTFMETSVERSPRAAALYPRKNIMNDDCEKHHWW